jgi:hypothetical protein
MEGLGSIETLAKLGGSPPQDVKNNNIVSVTTLKNDFIE